MKCSMLDTGMKISHKIGGTHFKNLEKSEKGGGALIKWRALITSNTVCALRMNKKNIVYIRSHWDLSGKQLMFSTNTQVSCF